MYVKDIEDSCRRVLKGDEKALQQLGLNNVKYPVPKPQNTSNSSLQLNYNAQLNTAVAARELQLEFLEKQCQTTMEYIQAIAQAKKTKLKHSVDPEDVAEIMLSLIDQEKRKYWHEGDEARRSPSEVEEEDEEIEKETQPKSPECKEDDEEKHVKPMKRKAVIDIEEQSDTEESGDEEIEKETQPKSPECEEDDEDKHVKPMKRKAVIDIEEQSDTEESGDEEIENETQPKSPECEDDEDKHVKPMKRKAVIDIEEQSDTEESEEGSQEGETDREESKAETREEEIPAAGKEPKQTPSFSHHVNRECVVGHGCMYEGPNLKRHLTNVHAKKQHIHESQINRYFAMGLKGHKKRGPAVKTKAGKKTKGRWKRWCPQPDCNYHGAYLAHHLQNWHHMKPSSSTYKISLKIALKYKGLKEELQQMSTPSRARSKRPHSGDSDEEDVIAPTPPKRKTDTKSPAASVPARAKIFTTASKTSPAASKTLTAPSTTSTAPAKTSTAPSTTSTAPPKTSTATSKTSTAPAKNSDAVPCTSTSVQSEPSTKEPSVEESSDEDESEYPMQADYFEEQEPKTNRHKWLCQFYRYLFTPAAGFHKDKNRLQHACQVKRLIEETDPHGDDILFLVEDEGDRVWVNWVIPHLQKRKAGTLKSYLTSFEMFLEYASKKGKRPHLPVLDMEVKNQLFDFCNSLKKWRRCITKETTGAKWDRCLDESEHLLTSKEDEEILSSNSAVDGRAALAAADQAEDTKGLSITQYCDARDFLIVTLTRAVGTRPAALENATLEMFEKAKWDDEKRKKVMLMSSHKREEDGPAPIPMSPDTEYLITVFINKLRPLVSDEDARKSKIFLKNDGAPFQKGTIGRRVRVFVVKSGIRPDKPISATDFRKWIVTELKRKKRMGIPIDEQLL